VDPTEFQAMVDCEERHWWYRGRRAIVRSEVERLTRHGRPKLLDAGCGSGRMLNELGGDASVCGLDSSREAVALASARGHDVRLSRVEDMPYRAGTFDVVTCLDVLEHTPDDVRSLTELRRVTRVGGHLVVTVPAYKFLWSTHDVVNEHYRRYGRSSLRAAASAAGWEVVRDTYFNFILLVPAALLRLVRRRLAARSKRSDLTLSPKWLDPALAIPLRLEAGLLRRGAKLPAGLSLLAILRNPGERSSANGVSDGSRGTAIPRRLVRAASHEVPRQFVKFVVVGISNTLISLAAYVLAVRAGVPYLLASIAAFLLGAVNGYSLNRVWTFRAGAFAPSGLIRYAAVQGVGLAANAGLLAALVEISRLDRILAQALALPVASALTFALNRSWAFRPATGHPHEPFHLRPRQARAPVPAESAPQKRRRCM
jgi:putative flippase GtrA/SAM-dependent methyltransferase